jgi:DJ-1 family protein
MKVLVPIANGSEEMEAVIIVDVLRRAGVNVLFAGDADIVTCSRGVRILPDVIFQDIGEEELFDAVVLPGGQQGVQHLVENNQIRDLVDSHRKAGKLVAAICAAPAMLHEWGMLERSNVVTGHPSIEQQLRPYTFSFDRVVEDGALITSRGAGTALEFALALVRRLVGQETARNVARDIVLYE